MSNTNSVSSISPCEYTLIVDKLRAFFQSNGFLEVSVQDKLSVLSACEDPSTMSIFSYGGLVWPLPQTGQLMLERELLKNPLGPRGYFCVTTSYRNEHNPVPGRHDGIFPMVEYEMRGGVSELAVLQRKLLDFFGFDKFYTAEYPGGEYLEVSAEFGKDRAGEREEKLRREYGPVYFLRNDADSPTPFWNGKKLDVILHGIETIGGAERLCNVHAMRRRFYEIDEGRYASTLFSHFTRERVEKELDDYLSLPLFERCGGGIGLLRFLSALKRSGLEYAVPYPVPRAFSGESDSDSEHPTVRDVASIFEKVVIDRVDSDKDLNILSGKEPLPLVVENK